jgi:pimeloyl-ACP methyl ester carboxylesterase
VTGWSGGGPYAVAAAAYIDPARLRHVTAIAPACYGAFGENWAADHLSKADALGGYLATHFESGFRLMYAAIEVAADHFRATYIKDIAKAVNDYDRRILLQPDVETAFGEASAECFAQGSNGLVQDAELAYRRWAFDVTKIERPIHLWQGTDDKLVAFYINKTVADRMPGTVWHPVEGAGHFVAIGAADDIFAVAAKELRA